MGLDDRLDDRQAETGPAAPAAPPALCAPEAIEQLLAGTVGQTGSVVSDLEHRAVTLTSKADLDR